jgi:hypothetical protein
MLEITGFNILHPNRPQVQRTVSHILKSVLKQNQILHTLVSSFVSFCLEVKKWKKRTMGKNMACGKRMVPMRRGDHKITNVIKYKNSKLRQVSRDDPGSSYNDGAISDSVFWRTTAK